jgi:multicomponent K+:H+ antiporter subunit D
VNHLVIAPILLPLFAGAALLLIELVRPAWQRPVALAAVLLQLACALLLGAAVSGGAVLAYLTGNWAAPFGIVLVADRLSALLVLVTGVVGLAALGHAMQGWDRRGAHFHALFQFQLMGLNGAFLTGDLFNLFVFFEVLLIASYGLLLHGAGPARVRAGFQYVTINLVGSSLFLIALGLLYAAVGTLNMADVALKARQIAPSDLGLLQAAGAMLLVVFCIKAALLPLNFWLPDTYGAAAAPVAAVFALLTKVGFYAVARVFTLVFGASGLDLMEQAAPWLLAAALATIALGAAGALASRQLRGLAAFLILVSAGTLLGALAIGGAQPLAAALFYLAHSSFAGAAMFLTADLIARARGNLGDALHGPPAAAPANWLGVLFGVVALALAGLPPLSGFVAKLMLLQASAALPGASAYWIALLVGALVVTVALARAGSRLFWRTQGDASAEARDASGAAAAIGLAGVLVGMSLFAAPLQRYALAAAEQLLQPAAYVQAVLGTRPIVRSSQP